MSSLEVTNRWPYCETHLEESYTLQLFFMLSTNITCRYYYRTIHFNSTITAISYSDQFALYWMQFTKFVCYFSCCLLNNRLCEREREGRSWFHFLVAFSSACTMLMICRNPPVVASWITRLWHDYYYWIGIFLWQSMKFVDCRRTEASLGMTIKDDSMIRFDSNDSIS